MVFPWIPFGKGGKKLSDIEFLSIKEFDGKLVTNVSEQLDGGTGNAAALTASGGKDLYLVKGSILITQDTGTGTSVGCDIDLIADTVVKTQSKWRLLVIHQTDLGDHKPKDMIL